MWNVYIDDDNRLWPHCPYCTEDVSIESDECPDCGYRPDGLTEEETMQQLRMRTAQVAEGLRSRGLTRGQIIAGIDCFALSQWPTVGAQDRLFEQYKSLLREMVLRESHSGHKGIGWLKEGF